MTGTDAHDKQSLKFPRSVIIIIIVNFISKFSVVTFKGVLPLYFVEKLNFSEDEATVTFHVLQMILYTSALIGGILADSVFGKYKVLLSSIFLGSLSLIILNLALITSLHLPLKELTFLALIIFHIGFGGLMPSIFSFGGDQFLLPQQKKQLSAFFMLMYTVTSIGSVLTYFIAPILRKDIRCFGELSCYSLVFAVPTCSIVIALVTLLATKKLYQIRKTEDTIVIIEIVRCIIHALSRKLKCKEKRDHWLDYANDKYEVEFIEDIKSTFQTFILLLPTFMPSALVAAETTTMTFQATKMNGELFGYLIKPDQIRLVESVFAIVALPTFHYYVYPFLAKLCRINTPLKKLTMSMIIAASSYYVATIVEWKLESTYAPKPIEGSAHLRIYNTLDCEVIMNINEQKFIIHELDMWENLEMSLTGKQVFKYSAETKDCTRENMPSKYISGSFELLEMQAKSLASTETGLSYEFLDFNEKSLSGNPLVRALFLMDEDSSESNTLSIRMKEEVLSEIPIHGNITRSEFFEVVHGIYNIYINDQKVQSDVSLKIGGVYTVLGYISNTSKVAKVVTVTPPNSMHLLWIIPQQIILTLSIIILDAVGGDFAYSQAPASMKTFVQAYWLSLILLGHLTVVVVTEANFFDRKIFVFLLYAVLSTFAAIIFTLLAKSYKYRTVKDPIQDNSVN